MLVLVVLYWLLVICGALDFETDISEPSLDADIETDHAHHGVNTSGAWLTAGRFLGFSQVPIIVWLSFMVLFMWFGSLALNETWNPNSNSSKALLLLIPNLIGSLITTKLVTLPVAKLFKAMADADTEAEAVIGRIGTVCSIEADETYGQLEIPAQGVPLLINVRTHSGSLPKGTEAKVIAAGSENAFYFIESLKS